MANVLGGAIFKKWGYRPVMILAPCSFAVAVMYCVFLVKETKIRPPELMTSTMVRDLFKFENMKDSFKACTKKRPGNIRLQLWLLVWASCSHKFVDMGKYF